MRLTETSIIKPNHPEYKKILELAHKCKNLYNASNYDLKQSFLATKKSKTWQTQRKEFVHNKNPDYYALNSHVAGEVLMHLGRSYKGTVRKFQKSPSSKVRFPKYKPKDGYFLVTVPKLAISKNVRVVTDKKNPVYEYSLCPSGVDIRVKSSKENVVMVKFTVQNGGEYVKCYMTYEVKEPELKEDNQRYASIDLGLDNLAAMVTNTGTRPLLYNGKPVKSINQYYNKKKSKLQEQLPKCVKSSKCIRALGLKRLSKLDHELHQVSNSIIQYCVDNDISKLVIGSNKNWKESINIGRRNNQKFVSIPHARLISQLEYKAKLVGIETIVTEESYSSKASFFDRDPLPVFDSNSTVKLSFSGKRVKRGLYKTKSGKLINADVNGAFNIMRKVVDDAIVYNDSQSIEGFAGNPIRVTSDK